MAVAIKVSEDGEKVEVDIFARSSRKKEVVAVAAVEEACKIVALSFDI